MKKISITCARPIFIKLAAISAAIQKHNGPKDPSAQINHLIIHTGITMSKNV